MSKSGMMNSLYQMVVNAVTLSRDRLAGRLMDPRRDINSECGYPDPVDLTHYMEMYKREGFGARVVNIYPDECWSVPPQIKETEGKDKTTFETAWDELDQRVNLLHYMHRVDRVSGIGSYGVLFYGLKDGKSLDQPAAGIDEDGNPTGEATKTELMYVRAFDESVAQISGFETNPNSPRFGFPKYYNLSFFDSAGGSSIQGAVPTTHRQLKVHWTRVQHVADNCETSEVFGVPRQQDIFNRLYDLRKILGGSGEMFWKGGFPGYSFKVSPEAGDAELDKGSIREEFDRYSNQLQRYLALENVDVTQLAPQVANPMYHVRANIEAIATAKGVPLRVFLGSEEAKLASGQDIVTWNRRVMRRQSLYLTPKLVRPVINRLIILGVLPMPTQYRVVWENLNLPSGKEKLEIASKVTEALARYVTQGVCHIIRPEKFINQVLGLEIEVVEEILKDSPDPKADKLIKRLMETMNTNPTRAQNGDQFKGGNKASKKGGRTS